jgi:LytS/YehU family sensor histidine kinase
MEKERQQSELSALHAQIHPHFMMNSLNNLYGLSLAMDDRLPGLILKLSESMQYLLYKSNRDRVLLADEINFLNQYIDLETLRTDYPDKIRVKWEGEPGDKTSAPLLLLPLIENAFKHGSLAGHPDASISIDGEIGNGAIHLRVKNSVPASGHASGQPDKRGFGLENLCKRLEMLYPGNYELNTNDAGDHYFAYLKYPIS